MVSNMLPWPDALSLWVSEAEAMTCSILVVSVALLILVKSSAPALTRFSRMRLLTTFVSSLLERSSMLRNGPLASLSLTAVAIAASPTFLTAARP